MLLASFFVLNRYVSTPPFTQRAIYTPTRTDAVNQHTIYPYVHSFSNLPNNAAMLRPITIPDVMPSSLPQGSNFSLVAGECVAVGVLRPPLTYVMEVTSRRSTAPPMTTATSRRADNGMPS